MKGTIVKGIGGFYYVRCDDVVIECKARGKFRHNDITPLVGDNVEIVLNGDKGTIDKIYDRTSCLVRPYVANVTQAFIIFSLKNPDINIELLNKFLITCEYNNLKVYVCFNKLDIASEEANEAVEMVKKAGYEVIFLKAKEGIGLEHIIEKLKGNVSVFCGPSGVGKSTTLNKIAGKEVMKTGEISEKVGRGKHTTRHSELIRVGQGLVVDTPGFSSLDIDFITKEALKNCFPEFHSFLGECKFSGCLHYKEPSCKIKEAVANGNISEIRYNFYIKLLAEIINRR